jgi:hypothetical protein
MRRMEACAWVDRRHLRALPDQAIDAVGDPPIFYSLRRRIPHAQGEKADPLRACLKSHDLVNRLSMRRIAIRSISVSEVCTRCS